MGPLSQGQFETSYPLARVWGHKQSEQLKESGLNGEVIVKGAPGFKVRVMSLFAEIVTEGAEVEQEPHIELLNADEKRMVIVPSGLKIITARTIRMTWVAHPSIVPELGINKATAPLPNMLLEPGDELNFALTRPKGSYHMFTPWVVMELYEEPQHHENAEVASIADHLHRAAEAIENGTLEQGYPTR